MFAEQQQWFSYHMRPNHFKKVARSNQRFFTLDESYQRETESSLSGESDSIRLFDLQYSFLGLKKLIHTFGHEQGVFQCALGVMLNILSVRQEMLGQMDTRELITLVHKQSDGSLRFQNDLYGQAQDLEQMYMHGIEAVDPIMRPRYLKEAKQAIAVFEKLTKKLSVVDFSTNTQEFEEQLKSKGFHEEYIDICAPIVATVASFRNQANTIEDLQTLMAQGKQMRVLVSPHQLLSVSPPHWLHNKARTGFVWASECVVIPQTKEVFIRQNGKFAKTTESKLIPYLSYQQEQPHVFHSEQELMEFISEVVQQDYQQPKVLLDFLVQQYSGLRSLGKIDRRIKGGEIDIEPYFIAIKDLFEFELNRVGIDNLAQSSEKMAALSDLILHQIARNEPKALAQLVEKYKETVLTNPSISSISFTKNLGSFALQVDPRFALEIDASKFDCIAGTLPSLLGKNPRLSANIESMSFLSSLQQRKSGFSSRAELTEFCTAFGKDESLYSTLGTCAMCGREQTYIWSSKEGGCNVCPLCEVLDDQQRHGVNVDEEEQGKKSKTPQSQDEEFISPVSFGLNEAVSCITCGYQYLHAHAA